MKKFFLFAAAMLAAVTLNAREITIDLSTYTAVPHETSTITATVADGVLTANYVTNGAWEAPSIVLTLDNLEVTNLAFDYKGDASVEVWVSLLVYLEDTEGIKWYSNAADVCISTWYAEWDAKSYFPTDALWATPSHAAGDYPFVKLGFMANPENPTTGSFAIRNVKLTVPGDDTGIEDVNASVKAVKMVRNGQLIIVRDGKTFNAIGAEMK